MDTTLTLTLSISIFINILTLRWAYREYSARRRYQQEARVLRQALRGISSNSNRASVLGHWSIWLIAATFLLVVFLRMFL